MSIRPGNVSSKINPATVLGAAAGLNVPLNNSNFAIVPHAVITMVATATAGNRIYVVRFLSPLGNIITQTVATTAVTANQTTNLICMAGIIYSTIANPLSQNLPLPVELSVPSLSSIQIFDAANVDVADTAAVSCFFSL